MLEDLYITAPTRAVMVAAVTNVSCALVGVFLVLRRMSLMGDAISHAVLPGLVIAFLLSGSTGATPMLLGAAGAGLATTFLTQTLNRTGKVAADASLGVVYTTLFALGVVLVKRFLGQIHFDTACVYQGSLLKAALDTTPIAGIEIPQALIAATIVLALVVVVFLLLWKELTVSSFDPALSSTMGYSADLMHYLLMLLVAFTSVVSFQSIGAILVVAMLIAPAAAAHLLVDRLAPMALISAAIALMVSVAGYALASHWDVSPAGTMAALAGAAYFAAAIGSPRHGALAKLAANARLALRIRRDDLLAALYRGEETDGNAPMPRQEALHWADDGLYARWVLRRLKRWGQVSESSQGLKLTKAGRHAAAQLVRQHRLWEAYLVEHAGLQEDHVHDPAHVVEHYTGAELEAFLEQELSDAVRDPHGKEIPGREN
ncbi:Manganese transport system membrane protein MntB [Pseudobythopirellula maris]|uniref:Manganese transport system membrane protein MntB n=1 Tax=Pseudobythopirellula maris TaxID=2527991 RepID=A0A5C5ZSE1_9BACT|nr:metal ABC transporter permease [Pseudobythopirellula maris]TWT89988.1 Manganese transport system membrane protein MntB [Pseudobythopirellula maris]